MIAPPELGRENCSTSETTTSVPCVREAYNSVLLFVCLLLVAVFHKTLFFGRTVSHMIEWVSKDNFFASRYPYVQPIGGHDISPYVGFLSTCSFLHSNLAKFTLPLWNNICGAGYPFLADLNFPPLALWESIPYRVPYLYDLGIIVQPFVAAIGSIALSKRLKFSALTTAFVGVSFALYPRMLHRAECPAFFCLLPFFFLAFLNMRQAFNKKLVALASIFFAYCYTNVHPEIFIYFSIAAILFSLFWPDDVLSLKQRARNIILTTATTAAVTMLLVSPLLLQQVQYILNGDFFKNFDTPSVSDAPEFLVCEMISPKLGLDHIGLAVIPLAALGLISGHALVRPLLILIAIFGPIAFQPPFVHAILDHGPGALLVPEYFVPIVGFSLLLLGAVGLERLLRRETCNLTNAVALGSGIALVVACMVSRSVPLAGDFWLFLGCALIVGLGILKGNAKLKLGRQSIFVASACAIVAVAVNSLVMLDVARSTLRCERHVNLDEPDSTIDFLKTKNERCVAVRDPACHEPLFLFSNILSYFGIKDFIYNAPIRPRGYVRFMSFIGAENIKGWSFGLDIPAANFKRLGLAGIKYVITRGALNDIKPDVAAADKTQVSTKGLISGLRLESASFAQDTATRQLVGQVNWKLHASLLRYCSPSFQLVLLAPDNSVVAESPLTDVLVKMESNGPSHSSQDVALPIPLTLAGDYRVALRLYNHAWGKFVPLDSNSREIFSDALVISTLNVPKYAPQEHSISSVDSPRVRLAHEGPRGIRVYENPYALPIVFGVNSAQFVTTGDAALEALGDDSFDARTSVVIQAPASLSNASSDSSSAQSDITVKQNEALTNSDTVKLDVEAKSPGYVVMLQQHYPGWHCYVDGHESPILRANFLFQAVKVDAGKHTIEWRFVPMTWLIGLALMLVGAVIVLVAGVMPMLRRHEEIKERIIT